MAINPDDITTVRVDQLSPEVITLTSILPHQVGTDLKQASVQDLVNLVATAIGAGSGVGFLPISVTNGQQLPDVPIDPSFFLCGPGTYLNINGYADVICTGELNAVMSLSDHWEVAVEIPIIAETGVQTVTGSAVDNTDPLNPIIDIRTDVLQGYYVNSTQFDDLNFTPFIPNSAKIYVNNAAPFGIYIWNGSAYIIVAETNGGGGGTQTLAQTLVLGNATDGNDISLNTDDAILLDNGSRLKKGTSDAGYGGANGIALKCSLDYEFKWEAGRLYIMEQDGFTIRESSFNLESTPAVTDDYSKGYIVDSRWVNSKRNIFKCTDDTEGAAVWVAIGSQNLQQTMEAGRVYNQALAQYEYNLGFSESVFNASVKDINTDEKGNINIEPTQCVLLIENPNSLDYAYARVNNIQGFEVAVHKNTLGANKITVPYRTTTAGTSNFKLQNNLSSRDYELATLDDIPPIGSNLPIGGTAGQILTKVDASDYNATWQDNYADWTSVVKHTVKNDGTGLITKGTAVYVTGSNGTNMLVGKASNASEATSSKTMGLMQSDITTTGGTQTGFVITEGLLGGLNTAGTTAGDPVWLGVNGALIYGLINKPYAPAHLVFIGIVTKVSAGSGEIFVKVQNGFELKEIHDVDLISNAPTNNQALVYESATSLWKNKTIIEDSITDAVTDKAPSQNAVFDALALKATVTQFNSLRLPIASVGNTTLTGTVTETKVATLLANANVFDSACYIYLTYNFMKSVANAISIKLYVNTSDSLTGATLIGQYLTGSNRNVDFTRKFLLRGTTLDLLTDTTSRITNINTDTVFASSTTVTVAPTSALYFIFSVTLDLVGSVVTNKVAILEKQKL